jgi:hypothetical protein
MSISGRAYVGVAHKVAIKIFNSLDYNVSDIQEIILQFKHSLDSNVTVQFTKSDAEIQIESQNSLMLYIKPNKVTVPGNYELSLSWIDRNGQPHKGTVSENGIIRFYE